MTQDERRIYLIKALLAERADDEKIVVPEDADDQRALLRALMNVRPPAPVAAEMLAVQGAYLAERLHERGGAVDAEALPPVDAADPVLSRVALWHGDITRLAADAIVNAANDQLLGCFVPGHHCIDNAIHTYAGMQLRLDCARLMATQGHAEPAGQVKVTRAYNLPSGLVFHTVGPIVQGGRPTLRDEAFLASCYRACLAEATTRGLSTLAFCCISTGIFGFPQEEAARIALDAILDHLTHHDQRLKVIIDVFLDTDQRIYQELLDRARAACRRA
ncbi:protein-ADP-ribose hydrolase [Olsenella uli]|uniref:protein-ADP-ribose hydrolase n=1 Tax=Olsenella uli TaxID=133926 RepID=UPI00195AB776|nr:protein-ADP-ribose hydrolase [Olsenella uli]MBM6675686.1 protein-ADP-ribose hydrolase [Olsenella uli]